MFRLIIKKILIMDNSRIDNNKIRQLTFYGLLLFLFVFLFLKMHAFLSAFLGAITFYMLFRKIMHRLVDQKKWKKGLVATFILIVSFLVILVPIWIFISIISSRLGYVLANSSRLIEALNIFLAKMETRFNIDILGTFNTNNISTTITHWVRDILTGTFNSITSVVLMYFILYFMLVSSHEMENWLYKYIPLKKGNTKLLGSEMKSLVISNAIGIPMVAVLQGFVGLIAYLILGVNDAWFWFVLTCIASMVPFVGSAMAYVPLSIVLFAQNQTWQGVAMLLYGLIIIGTVDNVFRFMLQKKLGDVHPLITVFGVVIGLNIFGFIGLIFGPILISTFIILVKIYMNEFTDSNNIITEEGKIMSTSAD